MNCFNSPDVYMVDLGEFMRNDMACEWETELYDMLFEARRSSSELSIFCGHQPHDEHSKMLFTSSEKDDKIVWNAKLELK